MCWIGALLFSVYQLVGAKEIVSTPKKFATIQPTWPSHVKPFFLSATSTALTQSQAQYISSFPISIINHKQSLHDFPTNQNEEQKQLEAIHAIKRANASCKTLFYLNSLIDFSTLDLHEKFVAANGSWWLRRDDGTFVLQHDGSKTFDWTVADARNTWLSTALAVVSNSSVDGIFVDKAGKQVRMKGINTDRVAAWNLGHDALLADLRKTVPPSKLIILNNRHGSGEGQLFERWGNKLDHDLLNITQDITQLAANSRANLLSLARAGGATPGSEDRPDPQSCAAGLAAMLMAVSTPDTSFFTCASDFNSAHTWFSVLNESIYSLPLGAPIGNYKINGTSGLMTRYFSSGTVAVINGSAPNLGCVKWASGAITGTCPV